MSALPEPDAEELAERLRAHLAEILRLVAERSRRRRRAGRRNRRAVSPGGLTNE